MRSQTMPRKSLRRIASAKDRQKTCQGCGRRRSLVTSFAMLQWSLHQHSNRIGVPLLNRASAGLENVITRALHRAPRDESPLLAWPVACGSAVAERTRALSFSGGILRVEVADAGWRRE